MRCSQQFNLACLHEAFAHVRDCLKCNKFSNFSVARPPCELMQAWHHLRIERMTVQIFVEVCIAIPEQRHVATDSR